MQDMKAHNDAVEAQKNNENTDEVKEELQITVFVKEYREAMRFFAKQDSESQRRVSKISKIDHPLGRK